MKRLAGRTGAGLLMLALAISLVTAAWAASYMQPYLEKVVQWGVMRGDIDGNLNENNNITRAEFSTMINRAFGYDQTGPTPFNDVPEDSWFAEDVGIAYNMGYIAGTSATTFSPYAPITREQASVMLARILCLEAQVGENTMFSDSRNMENWSRGYIASIAQQGLISGYPDGRFGPKDNLTRGQAAIILVNALGTPIMEAGDYTLGSVWGNVTISESGVTLRNTVIGGNLYITEGVDLGNVLLENVTVLGEIIVSGGGASEGGEDSIILRNVTAPKLLVDNMDNHYLSLKVEGDGKINEAYVRTNAYLADNTVDGCGIAKINLDGEEGLSLTLAGNIKEVLNTTPKSSISLASGQADTITMDEKAVDSTLNIAAGSRVDNVNLDTAVEVTGGGDIGKLTVNSDGSTVSMLPDEIVIRPGNTANINGENMDSAAAAESSADPRLYAGYPKMKDLAPTSGTAVFSANKKGTVHWALTAVTDGSVTADELINPSAYNPKVVKNGTVSLTGAGKEATASISGLISDGSYYLSAVFVDARENRSPLKVISFTTPDDTKPDFASGYPYLSKITNISAQVTTMATKSCRLYWAVLPKGATAPTAEDFKANAVTGNLGFGSTDVIKNTAYSFDVNNVPLEELESYDLYLWLTDVDNGQSSAVKKLSFTTVDGTPPKFNTEATVNKVDKNSVGLYANLNEDGTLYWVVVAQGEEYPKPLAGQTGTVPLNSDTAKLQVMNGMNALKNGKVNMTENKDISFTISGLDPEKAYDLYYVAQDKAGNFSATVIKTTIHTADPNAPTVTQQFSKPSPSDETTPYADTDVSLVFSESIQDDETNLDMAKLYDDMNKATGDEKDELQQQLASILRSNITLYYHSGIGQPEAVTEDKTADHWIDFESAVVEFKEEDGTTHITFKYGEGIQLMSGATYHFEVRGFADMSTEKNVMDPARLPDFTTLFAQISITDGRDTPETINKKEATSGKDGVIIDDVFQADGKPVESLPIDFYWQLQPLSASRVDDNIKWDMIIWSDTLIEFKLFRRGPDDNENWTYLGDCSVRVAANTPRLGVSLQMDIIAPSSTTGTFPQLNKLKDDAIYEYAMSIVSVQDSTDRNAWSQTITANINTVAGQNLYLSNLGMSITDQTWSQQVGAGKNVLNIGVPDNKTLQKSFRDLEAPHFISGYPTITAGDSTADINVMLSRGGTVFWMVAECNLVNTIGTDNNIDYGKTDTPNPDPSQPGLPYGNLPRSGAEDGLNNATGEQVEEGGKKFISMKDPTNTMISDPARWVTNEDIQYGFIQGGTAARSIFVEDLKANKDYIVYFVIQGTSSVFSPVMCYRFTTGDVTPAYITLDTLNNPEVGMKVSQDADQLYYALYASSDLPSVDEKGTPKKINEAMMENFLADDLTAPELADFKNRFGSYTVLDAMRTNYKPDSSDGESVFDHFASDAVKKTIYEILSAQGGSGSLAAGMLPDMKAGEREMVDFESAMDPNSITPYICVATAKNKLGGEWSFKAVNGVRIQDGQAPYLVNFSSSGMEMAGSPGYYSGQITLSFNEPLYFTDGVVSGNKLENIWPVVCDNITLDQAETQKKIGLLSTFSIGSKESYATLTYSGGSTTKPAFLYNIKFSYFQIGDTIDLPVGGYYTDLQENTDNTKRYQLQLQKVEGGTGGVIPNFGSAAQFVLTSGEVGP